MKNQTNNDLKNWENLWSLFNDLLREINEQENDQIKEAQANIEVEYLRDIENYSKLI